MERMVGVDKEDFVRPKQRTSYDLLKLALLV